MNQKKKIFREERLKRIVESVNKNFSVTVEDLAKEFGMSESSIRLDLAELDSRGHIIRTYGGAIKNDDYSTVQDGSDFLKDWRPILTHRINVNVKEKEAIGKLASEFVNNGDTIMVDGGSTTLSFVRNLYKKSGLTIITNALSLLPELTKIKNSEIFIVGGLFYSDNMVLSGDITVENIDRFHTMKAFIGIDGVSIEDGLTVANPSASSMVAPKRQIIESNDSVFVLCDSSKLGKTCLLPVVPIQSISTIITDSNADMDYCSKIEKLGVNIHKAEVK
jgi:DeoR/GlpR family transcriptional regulator of sugar metabolism